MRKGQWQRSILALPLCCFIQGVNLRAFLLVLFKLKLNKGQRFVDVSVDDVPEASCFC